MQLGNFIDYFLDVLHGLPLWLVITVIVCIISKLFGSAIKTMVKIVIFLLIVYMVMVFFGISLPSFNDISEFIGKF